MAFLLKNAHVVDPQCGIDGIRDVKIDGKVLEKPADANENDNEVDKMALAD